MLILFRLSLLIKVYRSLTSVTPLQPDRVIEFILHALNQDSMEVQATAAMGIAKLMLSGMITDVEVLKRLVLVYFAPETSDNLELRQCLSYFFPVYCYSLSANMKRMQEVSLFACGRSWTLPFRNCQTQRELMNLYVQIFLPTLDILTAVYEDLDDPAAMVSPTHLTNQLLDWTDPQKAVATEGNEVDDSIQVDLAVELLKEIYKLTKSGC